IRSLRNTLSVRSFSSLANSAVCSFFDLHLQFLVSTDLIGDFHNSRIKGFVEQLSALELAHDNPFKQNKWWFLKHGNGPRNKLERKGYISGKVDRPIRDRGPRGKFFFVRCNQQKQYYVLPNQLRKFDGSRVP